MDQPDISPGPIAEHTFERGLQIAALAGLAGLGLLFLSGTLSFSGVHLTISFVLFPVYILAVALVLGVWLGYQTDQSNLRRVSEPVEMRSGESWWDRSK